MPSRDSIPVERRTVSAMVCAASPAVSISSYSHTPSWTTVRRPAVTNRLEGAVGSPNSSGRPSAVSPRVTTENALSAWECCAGSGRGRWTRRRWSPLGLTNVVGPVVSARDAHAGPHGPALVDPDGHGQGDLDKGILPRRGVVVGVAQVAA